MIKKLHKQDTMWMVLGALISADSNIEKEETEKNLAAAKEMAEALMSCKDSDLDESFNKEVLDKYLNFLNDTINVLKEDEKKFKK